MLVRFAVLSAMFVSSSLMVQVVALGREPVVALDVEPEDLIPGLVAKYRSSTDDTATLDRVDPKPALQWTDSSPHPRIPAGPVEVNWEGVIRLRDPGPINFSALVCGEVEIEVGGQLVLSGVGQTITTRVGPGVKFDYEPGWYSFRVRYRSPPRAPARLRLDWEGPSFAGEPIPAWHLYHLPPAAEHPLVTALVVEQGRAMAQKFACRQCHADAFPGLAPRQAGPSLTDASARIDRAWLLKWLADPRAVQASASMPSLFVSGRQGFIERWILTEIFVPSTATRNTDPVPNANHRLGRRHFVDVGCAACHYLPDVPLDEQFAAGQSPFAEFGPRWTADTLADFLVTPHQRYSDGRMPAMRLTAEDARDIAAYLQLWLAKDFQVENADAPPTPEEIDAEIGRRGAKDLRDASIMIWREKRCAACHSLDKAPPDFPAVPWRQNHLNDGCLGGHNSVRFPWDHSVKATLTAYVAEASRETHPSPYFARQQQLEQKGCTRCHQRDTEAASPLEQIGARLGGAWLQHVPYQRTPRLTHPHLKFFSESLLKAVREGVTGIREPSYSYRMPAYGEEAPSLVAALAEQDGDLPAATDQAATLLADPTAVPQFGPALVGFQGYGCVSCHVWKGQKLADPDPGAVGPDLTRVNGRIQRAWFDRWLENPLRMHPGTPMPAVFPRGQPATLRNILEGDANRQREVLWAYLALGEAAPSPKPPQPLPVTAPRNDEPAIVAQIPLRVDKRLLESLVLMTDQNDVLVYDLETGGIHGVYTGAQILRQIQGRLRSYAVSGTAWGNGFQLTATGPASDPVAAVESSVWALRRAEAPAIAASTRTFRGYDRLTDGARLRWAIHANQTTWELKETIRLNHRPARELIHEWQMDSLPIDGTVIYQTRLPAGALPRAKADEGRLQVAKTSSSATGDLWKVEMTASRQGKIAAEWRVDLPEAITAPRYERPALIDSGRPTGPLERPGYRAIEYPRPPAVSGEDLVMPGAVSVDPKTGRVFVASMKLGELFVLEDPQGDGRGARFIDYARGLFQEAYSMKAEQDGLYVLHRRNLTKVQDTDGDGLADRFDRIAALAHGIGEKYDYAYGLVRDRSGSFVISYAPYANATLPGSGGAIRLSPGGSSPEEIAFGFRNPVGWTAGPNGEVFYTDNQGEWVATNKLCHIVPGNYYGFPNPAQRQHITRPFAKTSLWIPYAWARSINGVTYDNTEGKFGPFAGQFFLAELMFGGAIIRAQLEEINGVYQGACFPFWGTGLLGPLTLAFAPTGPLYVGSITEPGWMAQPDRGALFRIDYTQEVPFEIHSIQVQPQGFRLRFTRPVTEETGRMASSYQLERYRYEYTSAYGSPELDRGAVTIESVELAADRQSVLLRTEPLVPDRVYLVTARGVRSDTGEPLVHSTGAYTLQVIPK